MTFADIISIGIIAIFATILYWALDKFGGKSNPRDVLAIVKNLIFTAVGEANQIVVNDLKSEDKFGDYEKDKVFEYVFDFVISHTPKSVQKVVRKYYESFEDYVSLEIENAVLAYKGLPTGFAELIEPDSIDYSEYKDSDEDNDIPSFKEAIDSNASLEECFEAVDQWLKEAEQYDVNIEDCAPVIKDAEAFKKWMNREKDPEVEKILAELDAKNDSATEEENAELSDEERIHEISISMQLDNSFINNDKVCAKAQKMLSAIRNPNNTTEEDAELSEDESDDDDDGIVEEASEPLDK